MKKFFFPNNQEMLVYADDGMLIGAYEYPAEEVKKYSWTSQHELLNFLTQLIHTRSPVLKPLPVDYVEQFPMEYFHFQPLSHHLVGNA